MRRQKKFGTMSIRKQERTSKRYWINRLVALKRIIADQEIADILLVWDGFKPAAMVELSYFPRLKFSRKEFYKKIGDLEKILQKLNLKYRLQVNYPKRKKEVTRYSYVARNQRKLKEIIAADAEINTKKRRLKVGLLLGYPKTAIHAFANSKVLNRFPSYVLKREELKFLNFRLSKHWKEELVYLKRKAEVIKRIVPDLYIKIIKGSKKIRQFRDVSRSSS